MGPHARTFSARPFFPRLQLIRLPNLFTAMADVLAGCLIAAGAGFRWGVLLPLLLATSSFYAAGCVLNDLRDRDIDRRERPFRPIPSGRVSTREAAILAVALFTVGLSAAAAAGGNSLAIAAALTGLIVLYNVRTKHRALLGPATMAACRGLNLLLGMSPALAAGTTLIFPLVSFSYVFLLTCLSRHEMTGGEEADLRSLAAAWLALALGLPALFTVGVLRVDALPYLLLLFLLAAPPVVRALRRPHPAHVEKAVKILVLGIPLLDAVYAAGVQGWKFGIPVILLLLPARLAARALYVT